MGQPSDHYAVVTLVATWIHVVRGAPCFWLVDNFSANTALANAGSPKECVLRGALTATAMTASLGCRVWFERVPNVESTAGVLSRGAIQYPTVASHLADVGLRCSLDFQSLWGWGLAFHFRVGWLGTDRLRDLLSCLNACTPRGFERTDSQSLEAREIA